MSKKTEPTPAPAKGWGFPASSKKAHYFNGEARSLCGGWLFTGMLEDNNHRSLDNCKSCMKKRDKLFPEPPKESKP